MSDEKLKFANMIKKKIDKLNEEIYLLMDLCPPIRKIKKVAKGERGWKQKIRVKNLIHRKKDTEIEIELSNEDIRALVDIRTAEREALRQVLDELR